MLNCLQLSNGAKELGGQTVTADSEHVQVLEPVVEAEN